MTGSDVGTPHANDSCTTPRLRFQIKRSARSTYLMVLLGLIIILQCQSIPTEAVPKIKLEKFEGLLRRMMLLKRTQRKLSRLPRIALWSILATQKRKLQSARVDILSELLQIHLYHQRYFEALDLEKKFIAFRILCGIEKSASPDDQEFVKQALPEVSLDAPDSLPMCKNKESVHEQQLKQWQKAVQALNEVEQIAVSDRLILRILKRAYDRSKLYHRQVRDLIFSSESIQNTENQKPNPSLAEDDILTGKIVTYNPEQLVQYVCEDPASPPESETRCPPRILDMFIELRNLEWTYNRIQTLNRLNEFDSNERTLLIPGIQKHIASLYNPLEELVSKRCFESLSEKLENGDPTLVFIEKAADRDFSWETDERCELMLLQRDVEDIKSITLRDQYRVQEEELKQKIVGLQTKLGLMYGDSLLKPDSTVRTIQSKIVKLYEYNSMLRINLSLVSQGYTTLSNDSSLNDWYLSSRFGKYATMILDAIEQKSQKHDAKNASKVKFRFKNSSASLDQRWIISHLYISKSLLMKCIHFPWTNHLGSGPHGDRWSNDASTPSVLQERCSHLAEDVIDVEMMMQKIHWGELTDAPDTLPKSKMKSLASAVFFIHEQIQLYRILQHFRRHIDRSVMNQSEPEVEVVVFQNWLEETIKKAEAVGDELGTKLRAAVSPFPIDKIKVLVSSNLENPPKPPPLPERLLMTDYYIRELTHELHDLAYGHHHVLQHLAMDRWYQYGSLKNLFSYAAFENHRDLITSKKNFENSIADYRSDLILRMSINERNEFKIEIPEVSDLNNHGAVYVNAVDEVLRSNIKEHPQGAGQVLAFQCFDYYLKTHQSYIFLDRIALLRVMWHKSELLHTLTEDLIAWKHVSTEPMPTPNEFKDALQYLCQRYALAEDIIVKKISDCPPYIRQELEHLRLLEYKRARMKFLLNFIGSDTTTQSQVRSMLASKIHHLEETANISHELRAIFENIKGDTYETYEKCAADCTEENQCVPLRDCLNLNTLMETLIRFDSEDGLQLDAMQRQFFEYLVAQFDVEKLVPLFLLHVTWFCEQLVVHNARIVQQIQETRSFLGYTGIPLLPINRPGLLQLAHNMLHLRKALNHQHSVATDSYSFTRFRPPQISLLAFEFSRRKTMLFYESGLERVLRTYLSQPCEASGATLLPAGTDKTKVPLIPVFIESTYSMLNECIARSNSRALSNCVSIAEVYLQLYAWLLDFQVFVPSVASYLSKLNQDLEDRIEEQNLLEESTIYYMLPHPIQFSAEGRNPSEQSSTESHDLNVSIAEYSFRFSSQRLKEALESKVQFYRLSMELHGSDAKEAMVEAEKEVAPVASTDLEQTKQGEHIKEPVVQVPPPPHGIVVSPPSEERHYHHTPDSTMEPSTPTATTTTPTATTTTPTATTTTPTATTTTPTATTTTPTTTTTTPTATTTTPTQIPEREKPPSAWSEGALRIAESNASLPDSEKNTTVQSHTPPIRQTHPSLDHPPLHHHPRAWVVVATLCTIVLMFICICVLSVRRKRRSRGTTYRNFGHAEGSLYNEYPMCGTEQELNPTN